MRGGGAVLVLVALLLFIPSAGAAAHLVITQPSANETLLAEMRDFYVYGIFSGTVSNPGDVRIEVYSGDAVAGTPVRVIQSQVDPVTGITNETVIDTGYANGTRKNGAMVPDLVKLPGSILDTSNKVVVTNRYYMGLIPGGVTKNFDTSYKDSTGTLLTDLTAGNYTIEVTGLSGTCAGEKVNKTITLGLTNAILGTFRPDSTKAALIQYGIRHSRRSYFDWFPGYFTDPDNSSIWYTADQRWTPNNGIEVVNDRPGTLLDNTVVANNTMFIYNINSGSATYRVELAALLRYNLQDGVNTTFLYYDIGEPNLTYNDLSSGVTTINGNPLPFPSGSRIKLYRAEILTPTGTNYENLYDCNDVTTQKSLNLDPSSGFTITSGKEFIIYGVTKPIASSVTATTTPYRYTIDNRITTIDCTINNSAGSVVMSGSHDVNLSRLYYRGSATRYNSFWEFGIDVSGLTAPDTYTVNLTGKDASGTIISGAATGFTVTVNPIPVPTPEGQDDRGGRSGASQVAVSPGAPAGQPVTFVFAPGQSSGTTAVESVTLTPSRTVGQVECIVRSAVPGNSIQITDREVAGYQSITVNWINPDAIDHADIAFSVDKSWLASHHVAPEQVVMLHFTGGRWVELPTSLVNNRDTVYEYSAVTGSFSYFAIAAKAGTPVAAGMNSTVFLPLPAGNVSAQNTITGIPATGAPGITTVVPVTSTAAPPARPTLIGVFFPQSGLPLVTIAAWAIVIVLLIIAIWLIRRWWIRRQNPALFRKYN
ncbi:MAG: PGF-pre-PGF domain-containing protein [Methanoregula sp.]